MRSVAILGCLFSFFGLEASEIAKGDVDPIVQSQRENCQRLETDPKFREQCVQNWLSAIRRLLVDANRNGENLEEIFGVDTSRDASYTAVVNQRTHLVFYDTGKGIDVFLRKEDLDHLRTRRSSRDPQSAQLLITLQPDHPWDRVFHFSAPVWDPTNRPHTVSGVVVYGIKKERPSNLLSISLPGSSMLPQNIGPIVQCPEETSQLLETDPKFRENLLKGWVWAIRDCLSQVVGEGKNYEKIFEVRKSRDHSYLATIYRYTHIVFRDAVHGIDVFLNMKNLGYLLESGFQDIFTSKDLSTSPQPDHLWDRVFHFSVKVPRGTGMPCKLYGSAVYGIKKERPKDLQPIVLD